jgi:predicted nucleotidyltransferase
MSSSANAATGDLPAAAATVLTDFVAKARESLGADLRSVVLYGSAAEGRLRPTSDLNVIVVLDRFEAARLDPLREALRVGRAAARLAVMFLLAGEVPAAMEAFAAKFADVRRRRRVLFGEDPFTGLTIPRAAEIARLRQVLLNKEALEKLAAEAAADGFRETLRRLSEARETRALVPGTAAPALLGLVDLAQRLRALAEATR